LKKRKYFNHLKNCLPLMEIGRQFAIVFWQAGCSCAGSRDLRVRQGHIILGGYCDEES